MSKSLDGVNIELRLRVEHLMKTVPGTWVESAFRSYAEQERLYKLAQEGKGASANKPGTSKHERGLAVDVACDAANVKARAKAAKACGLITPFKKEPWHMELDPNRKGLPALTEEQKATLMKTVVGISSTKTGCGIWFVASDGGVFAFGEAQFFGSMGGQPLNSPIVGMAPTPSNKGYWLVASDGGVFCYGDAKFFGSMGGKNLAQPVIGIASTANGDGYWLAAKDGGQFAFGAAKYLKTPEGKDLTEILKG